MCLLGREKAQCVHADNIVLALCDHKKIGSLRIKMNLKEKLL